MMESSTLVSVIILLTSSCSSCDMEALTILILASFGLACLTYSVFFLELTASTLESLSEEEPSSWPLDDSSSLDEDWAFFLTAAGLAGAFFYYAEDVALLLRLATAFLVASSLDEESSSPLDESSD